MASPASGDTVADPPAWGFNPAGNAGDFARLVPRSPLARRAFSDVVQRMHEDPHWNPHAHRFIHFAEFTGSTSDSDSSASGGSPPREVQWYGHYRLNWDIHPARLRLGWVLGSSRDGEPDSVDLLLTPQPRQYGVGSRHCRLACNPDSGALLIAADSHRVTVDGTATLRHDSRVAYRTTGILIHDLAYTLEFTDLDPSVSRAQMRNALDLQCPDSRHPINSALTPTPNGAVSVCGEYVVHAPGASGALGMVSYGNHLRTGEAVAIKKVRGSRAIDHEVRILQSLDHENVCRLEAVMNASGNLVPAAVEERLMVLNPLATCTLTDYVSIPLRPSELLDVTTQLLSAVHYIHGEGIMHRDVKPANVGVVVYPEKLRVVLFDFGHATRDAASTDHFKGTVPYLAPEVIALKEGRSSAPYDRLVDIWGVGLCLFELVSQAKVRWERISDVRHARVMERLQALKSASDDLLQHCVGDIGRMLAWDAAERPSAAQLVAAMPSTTRTPDGASGSMPPAKRPKVES